MIEIEPLEERGFGFSIIVLFLEGDLGGEAKCVGFSMLCYGNIEVGGKGVRISMCGCAVF